MLEAFIKSTSKTTDLQHILNKLNCTVSYFGRNKGKGNFEYYPRY